MILEPATAIAAEDVFARVMDPVRSHQAIDLGRHLEERLAGVVEGRARCRAAIAQIVELEPPSGAGEWLDIKQIVNVESSADLDAEDSVDAKGDRLERSEGIVGVRLEEW